MEIENFVNLVRNAAILSGQKVRSSRWYIFGSAVTDKRLVNDYDVLVVYQKDEDREIIREGLEAILSTVPVHLFMMTEDEEHQCQFIALQRARHIFG